jgi:hypothetical protein
MFAAATHEAARAFRLIGAMSADSGLQGKIPRGPSFLGRPLAGAVSAARRHRRLSPEVLKSIRRKFGVTHRVLDVLVAEPSL